MWIANNVRLIKGRKFTKFMQKWQHIQTKSIHSKTLGDTDRYEWEMEVSQKLSSKYNRAHLHKFTGR